MVKEGRVWGLGISNMKGALACYVEAVRALIDSGLRLRGDVTIAAVVGEIEKTQWGEEFRGRDYRGYAAGSRHLVTHGAVADMCVLGEPTEQRIVLGHYGAMWCRIGVGGPFVHTAFSEGRLPENSIVRAREVLDHVLEWIPEWEERASYRGLRGVVNVGAMRGGFPWRLSRTPGRTDLFLDVRVPPTMPMQDARRAFDELVRDLRERHPDWGIDSEVYVTAPGAEIDHRPSAGRGDRPRPFDGLRRASGARRRALVLRRLGAYPLRRGHASTTAPPAACRTPRARTSTSRASCGSPRSMPSSRRRSAGWPSEAGHLRHSGRRASLRGGAGRRGDPARRAGPAHALRARRRGSPRRGRRRARSWRSPT